MSYFLLRYKLIKGSKGDTGRGARRSWDFFKPMDEVLDRDPSCVPVQNVSSENGAKYTFDIFCASYMLFWFVFVLSTKLFLEWHKVQKPPPPYTTTQPFINPTIDANSPYGLQLLKQRGTGKVSLLICWLLRR